MNMFWDVLVVVATPSINQILLLLAKDGIRKK